MLRGMGDERGERDGVIRIAAFTKGSVGGNPAGVVVDAADWDDDRMQRVAAKVGYSETAFVTAGDPANRRYNLRYFSPGAEVPFCGHATLATAGELAERVGPGSFTFDTNAGEVRIETAVESGTTTAAFTSVEPRLTQLSPQDLDQLLLLFGLALSDLRAAYPPRLAYAGASHPMLLLRDRSNFDALTFDPGAARALMDTRGWTTIAVLWQESSSEYHARNVFPVGDIIEDPATGAAAAATGAYLRELRALPTTGITIEQGGHVGHPSLLQVTAQPEGGVTVSGTVRRI